MPPAGRVALIGAASGPVATALGERGCEFVAAGTVSDAVDSFAGEGTFDAVVLAEGFEYLDDPVDALRSLAKFGAAAAPLVVVARNASHGAARLKALVASTSAQSGSLPPRAYDLQALETVIGAAGLVVTERLRHVEPVDAAALDAVVPGLAAVISGDDADTVAYVLVTNRSDHDGPSATASVAEALQAELARANAALAEAAETIAAHERELANRHDALVERVELIDRLYTERRHLELEVVVKDDYIAILRQDRNDWRNFQKITQHEIDELRRSRHYQVASILHKVLIRIPFLHRAAKSAAKVAATTKTTP